RQQADDAARAGAEDLPDADLFHPLGDRKGGKTKKAQTGNEDRDAGKCGEQAPLSLFRLIQFVEAVIQECVFEGYFGEKAFPCFLYMCKGGGVIAAGQLDRDAAVRVAGLRFGGHDKNDRQDLLVHGFEIEITHDTDDVSFHAAIAETLAHHFVRRPYAEDAGGCYIEQEIIRIGGIVAGEIPAGCHRDAVSLDKILIHAYIFDVGGNGAERVPAFGLGALFIQEPAAGNTRGAGGVEDMGILEKGVTEGLVGLVESIVIAHGNDMLFVESKRSVLHIIQLLEDDGGGYQQDDRNGELRYYEHFSERNGPVAGLEKTFQHFHRLEGGQENGRIKARERTDEQRRQQQGNEHPCLKDT